MITNLIFNALFAPIWLLLDSVPTATSLTINTWANDVVNYFPALGWVNDYFPLAQAMDAITLILSVVGVMLIVNLALWVYHQLPTVGGGNG